MAVVVPAPILGSGQRKCCQQFRLHASMMQQSTVMYIPWITSNLFA